MKKSLTAALALIALILFSACSRSNEEQTLGLLSNVPADSPAVIVLNLSTIADEAGATVKDGRLTDPGKLSDLSHMLGLKGEEAKWMEMFLSPDSGVEFTSAVVFYNAGHAFLTMNLADPEATRRTIDTEWTGAWEQFGKITAKKKVIYICQDRLFLGDGLSPELVERWMGLSQVESVAGLDYAKRLASTTKSAAMCSSIDGMLDLAALTFSQRAATRMVLGMCFKSPKYLFGEADIEKEMLHTTLQVLDQNLEAAPCELKLSEIDVPFVAGLKGEANTIAAVAISEKLVKQITLAAASFGGGMPPVFEQVLQAVDGTIALGATPEASEIAGGKLGGGFKLMIQSSTNNNAALLQFLQQFGSPQLDGNTFTLQNEGYGHGVMDVAKTAEYFKGAWLGVAIAEPREDNSDPREVILTFKPVSGSLELNADIRL